MRWRGRGGGVTVRLDSRRIVDDGMAAVAAGEETARCWWVALQMQAGATQLRRTLPPPENQVKSKKKCLLVICQSAHVPPPLMNDTSHMTVSFVTFKLYMQKEKNAHELW